MQLWGHLVSVTAEVLQNKQVEEQYVGLGASCFSSSRRYFRVRGLNNMQLRRYPPPPPPPPQEIHKNQTL